MKTTLKIEKAIKKATELHEGQFRKNTEKIPYISHPIEVTELLSSYTSDEEVIVAGLLHDTIEDTEYSPKELEKEFGKKVYQIVIGVTEPKIDSNGQKLPWVKRKAGYVNNLDKVIQESLLVCAADKICNMQNQINDYELNGEEFLHKFNSTPQERYTYHQKVLDVLKSKLKNSKIIAEYEKYLSESARLTKKN